MEKTVKGRSLGQAHPFREGGFALPAAIAVLVLLSVLVVTVYANSMASFRSGSTDLGKARSQFAAEAGAETAMAQLALALQDAVIEDAELAAITPPAIPGFTYDSFVVSRVGGIVVSTITNGPFTGLQSLTQMVDIYAESRDADNNSTAVVVTAAAQAIPIFQFGVFYEKDLEIDNLPLMTFGGWVHSNGSIWTGPSGAGAIYEGMITTPNKYYWDAKAFHVATPAVWIDDATTANVAVNGDSRTYPNANNFRTWSNTRWDDRLKTDAYGVDSLEVPLPSGVPPLAIIQPRSFADGTVEQAAKFAWKSDFVITIDLSRIPNEATALLETQRLCKTTTPPISYIRDGGQPVPDSIACTRIFDYEHDKFYEERERMWVNVLDINVDSLQAWATGTPAWNALAPSANNGDTTAIVYINMLTAGAVDPRGGGHYPIVRLRTTDGGLTFPLTVATQHPIYTWGNYNSTGWQPAALIADAYTVLSPAWVDAQHDVACVNRRWESVSPACTSQTLVQNVGTNTSVYAAVLAGHSSSACDHHAGVNNGNCTAASNVANYGGGLENFPRFLEDFRTSNTTSSATNTVTYFGSLVSLFYNQQGTVGNWFYNNNTTNTNEYYSPPTRAWQFDTRFLIPANLPPGTPVVGNVIATAFRPVF